MCELRIKNSECTREIKRKNYVVQRRGSCRATNAAHLRTAMAWPRAHRSAETTWSPQWFVENNQFPPQYRIGSWKKKNIILLDAMQWPSISLLRNHSWCRGCSVVFWGPSGQRRPHCPSFGLPNFVVARFPSAIGTPLLSRTNWKTFLVSWKVWKSLWDRCRDVVFPRSYAALGWERQDVNNGCMMSWTRKFSICLHPPKHGPRKHVRRSEWSNCQKNINKS